MEFIWIVCIPRGFKSSRSLCGQLQGVSRFLDRTGNEDRAAIKLHAKAAEFEYDDEYDDSYDDLGGGGADGIADVEGAFPHHQLLLQKHFCSAVGSYVPIVDLERTECLDACMANCRFIRLCMLNSTALPQEMHR